MTRNMATTAARNAVFNTTELLESILIRLPYKDLFVLQRVSHKFKDVISGSVRLQQRMFLRSCVARESWTLRCKNRSGQTPSNSMAAKLVPDPFDFGEVEVVPPSDSVTNALKQFTPVVLCPLVKDFGQVFNDFIDLQNSEQESSLSLTKLLKHPGSWRSMQLADPSVNEVLIIGSLNFYEPDGKTMVVQSLRLRDSSSDTAGVKLGTIADIMLNSREPAPRNTTSRWSSKSLPQRYSITAAEALQRYEEAGLVSSFDLFIRLPSVVTATEQEWNEVRSKASE